MLDKHASFWMKTSFHRESLSLEELKREARSRKKYGQGKHRETSRVKRGAARKGLGAGKGLAAG